jgi:hypothetical protein
VYPHQERNPVRLIEDFANCCMILWRDKLGQISLAVTTLFWGTGATLQFIVLEWAKQAMGMSYEKATTMVGLVGLGVTVGAIMSAKMVTLRKSLSVIPLGIAMGFMVMTMAFIHTPAIAYPMLIVIGALAGYFVVPMNALLQHRGHVLMSAGHSIAVQNFNENLSILVMLAMYSLMLRMDLALNTIIVLFGLFLSGTMIAIKRLHVANQREHDSLALIGEHKHYSVRAGGFSPVALRSAARAGQSSRTMKARPSSSSQPFSSRTDATITGEASPPNSSASTPASAARENGGGTAAGSPASARTFSGASHCRRGITTKRSPGCSPPCAKPESVCHRPRQ